ncbi:4'-phosphopantetheinyl transferase family protein [Dactylosporangium sp. CS-033363]|uniref:4'-phosphopantetheinyl transferase family protein n=1 Tax=Dactylosporangium sp. CS-033363 TaxID=3239935 RepID=UPI003D92C1A9
MTTLVDIWLVDARAPFDECLNPDERRRHDALSSPDDRRRFASAHSALHRILPGRRWTRGPNGKPELIGTTLQVNLSHAGEWAAIALTDGRPVGVDLQDLVSGLDYAAMARRFFPPVEADVTELGTFSQLWARKEAVVKAAGDRLTRGLLLPVAGDPPPQVTHDGVVYTLADFEAPEGFRAAVALQGPEPFVIRTH